MYTVRLSRPDGKKAWAGGKDLALSAGFTGFFCRAILYCWLDERQSTGPQPTTSPPVVLQVDENPSDIPMAELAASEVAPTVADSPVSEFKIASDSLEC